MGLTGQEAPGPATGEHQTEQQALKAWLSRPSPSLSLTSELLKEGTALPGISGQEDTAASASCPLQTKALARKAELHATQILQRDGQGGLEPASRRPAVDRAR